MLLFSLSMCNLNVVPWRDSPNRCLEGGSPYLECRVVNKVSFELNSSGILLAVQGLWRSHYLNPAHLFDGGRAFGQLAIG